jgi:hypothetical protein
VATRYAHVLLFICPECDLPVAVSRVSTEKNLESVDVQRLHIKCSYCEKESDVIAVAAKRHYVEDWDGFDTRQTVAEGDDEQHQHQRVQSP